MFYVKHNTEWESTVNLFVQNFRNDFVGHNGIRIGQPEDGNNVCLMGKLLVVKRFSDSELLDFCCSYTQDRKTWNNPPVTLLSAIKRSYTLIRSCLIWFSIFTVIVLGYTHPFIRTTLLSGYFLTEKVDFCGSIIFDNDFQPTNPYQWYFHTVPLSYTLWIWFPPPWWNLILY